MNLNALRLYYTLNFYADFSIENQVKYHKKRMHIKITLNFRNYFLKNVNFNNQKKKEYTHSYTRNRFIGIERKIITNSSGEEISAHDFTFRISILSVCNLAVR